MQYEAFFGFQRRPFVAGPQASAYFPAETCEAARKTLLRVVERGAGPGLLVGPPGTGKSLICHLLAGELASRFQVVPLMDGSVPATRRELWQTILFELDLPYKGLDEGELRLAVIGHLTRGKPDAAGLALLVDDAQHLSLEVLEELRLLGDIVRHGVPRVRVVLSGGSALEEKLGHPQLEAFSQRIAARAYLQPLNRDETYGYVGAQLSAAGGAHHVFGAEAVDQIYRAADGVPRLINQLCDQALLLAAQRGLRHVDARLVEEAWSELQQLPSPWAGSFAGAGAGDFGTGSGAETIEFGALDELPPAVAAEPAPAMPTVVVEFGMLEEPQQAKPKVIAQQPAVEPFVAPKPVVMTPAAAADLFEEEIVVDRYSTLDAQLGGKCRRVYLAEGLDVTLLAAEPVSPPAPPPPAPATLAAGPVQVALDPVVLGEAAEAPAGPIVPPPPIVPSLAVEPKLPPKFVAPLQPQPVLAISTESAEPEAVDPEPAIVPLPVHDDDLIVVEEDPDYTVGMSLVSFAPVRRDEYRTLFTRLRQGAPRQH